MHPEMIRAIAEQQISDRHSAARAGALAKLARQARRARRNRRSTDPLAGVRVPDYIDGTFHGETRTAAGEHAEPVR